MRHRHLNPERLTLAAIDDVIARGGWADWAELRAAALADRTILEKVARVAAAHAGAPHAQRHHFWRHYAMKPSGTSSWNRSAIEQTKYVVGLARRSGCAKRPSCRLTAKPRP